MLIRSMSVYSPLLLGLGFVALNISDATCGCPNLSDAIRTSDHLALDPALAGADPENGMHLLTLESSI